MSAHVMQSFLNGLLRSDTRPAAEQNRISRHLGRKRTHMRAAAVGASAVKDLVISVMKNAGVTHLQPRKVGPMLPPAIHQLRGAQDGEDKAGTCWILVNLLGLCFISPSYVDNLIVTVDDQNVILLLLWQGQIVAIHMTLEVSTAYNNPDDDDVRPEVILKGFSLVRAADWQTSHTADLALNDFGDPGIAAGSLGLDFSSLPAALSSIDAALSGKRFIVATTLAAPHDQYIRLHCYALLAKLAAGYRAQQPWFGGDDLTIPPDHVTSGGNFAGFISVSAPATLRLYPALVGVPTPASAVTPSATTYDRKALQPYYFAGKSGYSPTLAMYGDAHLTIPGSGTYSGSISVQPEQAGRAMLLNGSPLKTVGTVANFSNVAGPLVFAPGDGCDVVGLTLSPAILTNVPAPAPVLYSVTVTAPGGTPQTFSASKVIATLADGTPKAFPESE